MTPEAAAAEPVAIDVAALEQIQSRVLRLAANVVHVANKVRPNPSGIKVGGHHASSGVREVVRCHLGLRQIKAR